MPVQPVSPRIVTTDPMPGQPARPRIATTEKMPRGNTAANAKISRMLGIAVKTL